MVRGRRVSHRSGGVVLAVRVVTEVRVLESVLALGMVDEGRR